ncbi:cobalamin biosynthesis protein [Conexivisphaera calida]|uniref:Probable cobalamin biosynthesis protein CobD n=1 Tax=Conexivisphaera calida TaxID=1874277 RepID=A0A4P2VNR1_9ARCH|nr:cobalamin biosynthesis protein [Conexivisphaera calida]BBE42578.1 Adenosylcobinamide-phosphate synthase [Conexivisphaera calida]
MPDSCAALALLPLALGLALDAIYPYHRGPLLAIHPVHTSYVMALKLADSVRGRTGGIILWLAVVGSHIAIYGAALWTAWQLGYLVWIPVASYVVKVTIPVRLLFDHVEDARRHLVDGDLEGARSAAQGLVRRDLGRADAGHVSSAALESLFESLVDGITSPLFYYAFLGPLGALVQRLANTMDGAVGFRDERYSEIGWFSAKVDTALNYIPARLTALLEIAACALRRGDAARALKVYSRYRKATESVNAGHPLSAAAGCLGVRLEKEGSYSVGLGELPGPRDLAEGTRLADIALGLAAAVAVLVICALADVHLPWAM